MEEQSSEAIDSILSEARERYHTDAARAEAMARRVLDAVGTSDPGRRAAALGILGAIAFVRGELELAAARATEVAAWAATAPPTTAGCEAHLLLGAIARRQGDAATAIVQAELALKHALGAGDADMEMVARNNLGLAHADAHDPDAAVACYLAALDGFDRVSPGLARQLRGSLLNNIGLIHRGRGDHEAARERFAMGRESALEAGNRREAARIGRNLASVLITLERPDEAVAVLEAVSAEARSIGDGEVLLALSETCMGHARLTQGRPEEALAPLRSALDRMERRGGDAERADYAKACALYAQALVASGRPEQALDIVDAGLHRLGDGAGQARVTLLLHQVEALAVLGRHAEALEAMKALRVFETARHRRVLADQAHDLRQQLEVRERLREAERLHSERERLEAEVAARTVELREARDQAQAADRAKTAFLAVASHELRTPLNAIVGYAELIDDGLDDEEPEVLRHDLGRVVEAAELLTQHVDRILAMANLEAGAEVASVERVAVVPLVHEVGERQKAWLREGGNELVIEASGELEVEADRRLLADLVNELVHNAAKFTRDGTVTVRVDTTGPSPCIEVEDDGPGIEPEVLDRIFVPFGQRDVSATREHGGLGLGLSLCRRYAGLLGAELVVRSRPGHGSVFSVRLPAEGSSSRLDGVDGAG